MTGNVYFHIIVFLAGFTQGLTGFGSVLVGLPLLTVLMDVRTAVPLMCLLALCISVILFMQLREHLHWDKVRPLLISSVPGIVFGVYVLKRVPSRFLEFVIGTVLILFSLYRLSSGTLVREIPRRWAWVFGFLSGVLGGSVGANGPPVIIYTTQQSWGKYSVKSTLIGFFMVSGTGISSVHAVNGLITGQVLTLFAAGLPALVTGVLLGSHLFHRVHTRTYRRGLYFLLVILGVFMVIKAWAG